MLWFAGCVSTKEAPMRRFAMACSMLLATQWMGLSAPAVAETLRVGKSTLSSFSYTLLEVGMHSGIFKKHGLEIESSAFGGGPRLVQAMTAGAIDIGLDGGTDMAMIVKGAPMKGIAPLSGAPLEMVISVKANSPIRSVADLKGKKIAVSGAGTLTGWITRELVRSQGWTDSDMNYVMSSNVAASRALLKVARSTRSPPICRPRWRTNGAARSDCSTALVIW
jgi:NitT/TauT family transport system substrate-binding protein